MPPWLIPAALSLVVLTRPALGYVKGRPTFIFLRSIGYGAALARPAAKAFLRMQEAAARDGIWLRPGSGFRSWTSQAYLWTVAHAAAVKAAVLQLRPSLIDETVPPTAKPGYSNHNRGTAVDLANPQQPRASITFQSPEYKWLQANARLFGFKGLSTEAWHWEWVG